MQSLCYISKNNNIVINNSGLFSFCVCRYTNESVSGTPFHTSSNLMAFLLQPALPYSACYQNQVSRISSTTTGLAVFTQLSTASTPVCARISFVLHLRPLDLHRTRPGRALFQVPGNLFRRDGVHLRLEGFALVCSEIQNRRSITTAAVLDAAVLVNSSILEMLLPSETTKIIYPIHHLLV